MNLPLIHPMLVHFPIAFYFLELLLLGLWHFRDDEGYSGFALLVFRLAFVAMIFAAAAGLLDAGGLDGIVGKVRPHVNAALIMMGLQLARGIYWHFGKPYHRQGRLVLFASAVLGCAVVAYAGFKGGEIVYGD